MLRPKQLFIELASTSSCYAIFGIVFSLDRQRILQDDRFYMLLTFVEQIVCQFLTEAPNFWYLRVKFESSFIFSQPTFFKFRASFLSLVLKVLC
jgi:hypothetical protein